MNRFHIKKFLAGVLLVPAFTVHAVAPRVTASIDSASVEMGDYAQITVDIADAEKRGVFIDLPEAGAEAGPFDFSSVEADTFPGGFKYKLRIQAFEPGSVTFPPFRYVYGSDTAFSNALSLKIMPVELDSLETINPMAGTVNPPRKWYDYVPDWIFWALLGIALAGVGVSLFLIYRKHGTLIVRHVKPVDPYEAAMAELGRLREKKLAESGREKEFYTNLVDILRTYLERRFGIYAMEMSTTQILQTLRSNPLTRDNQPRIKQILELADFVKFANIRPLPDDNIKTFNNVVQFVEDTKPAPEVSENEGDGKPKTKENKQ
ncbi:MAG: hypothetical protein K2M19_06305 [Muribaculaceae bacterium]|nr:hypothetical protein [Muribaculaceae bacterium]